MVANAIELTRLHERIALSVLLKFGSNPKWFVYFIFLIKVFFLQFFNYQAHARLHDRDSFFIALDK